MQAVHNSSPASYAMHGLHLLLVRLEAHMHLIMGSLHAGGTQFFSSQLCHARTSSSVVPIALMSLLTQSTHLCFGVPLLLLPGGTISRVVPPTYSCSRFFTCPNHLNLALMQLSVIFSLCDHFSHGLLCVAACPSTHLHLFYLGDSHRHFLHPYQHNYTWLYSKLNCMNVFLVILENVEKLHAC